VKKKRRNKATKRKIKGGGLEKRRCGRQARRVVIGSRAGLDGALAPGRSTIQIQIQIQIHLHLAFVCFTFHLFNRSPPLLSTSVLQPPPNTRTFDTALPSTIFIAPLLTIQILITYLHPPLLNDITRLPNLYPRHLTRFLRLHPPLFDCSRPFKLPVATIHNPFI
jgi:hypothetical protein